MDLQNFVALAVAPVLPAVPVAAVLVPVPAAVPGLRQLPGHAAEIASQAATEAQPNHHLSYQQTADKSIWQIRLGTTA